MAARLKVLLSSYACEPGQGSEPGVGWNWVRHLSRDHDVWLITRSNNRGVIEAELARHPLPNAHFVYYDLPRWARFWKRGDFGLRPYYYLWQAGAYLAAKRLLRDVRFDLVQHITFVKYWMPSFMALLPVPMVWGTVGGGESAPRPFWPNFSLRGRLYEWGRETARAIGEWDPFVRMTARRASLGLATTEDTARRMRALGCKSVKVFPEAALSTAEIDMLGAFPLRRDGAFRLVSVGNLLHLKGFDLAIRAFAEYVRRGGQGEYWLLGGGPEMERLRALVASEGLDGKVKLLGRVPRAKVLETLEQCDVLVHPSLHDSGGWTCLEAMAAGRPVVCLDLGGPGVQVTNETGVKIPAVLPGQAIDAMAAAFSALAGDAGLRARMGQAGRRRVRRDFCWDTKPAAMLELAGCLAREESVA